jgi:hypothetical protein
MSHIIDAKMKVRDLDALDEALVLLGGELRRDQKTHAAYGSMRGKCDHAIRLKSHVDGDFEIGLVAAEDGDGFELKLDTWGGRGQKLLSAFGTNLNGLRQEYSAAVMTKTAKAKLARLGFTVKREQTQAGIRLRVRSR